MNTDDIELLQKLDNAASRLPLHKFNIREKVWAAIESRNIVIEVDSFRYLAMACAVAAIIALFFSVDILTNIQNTAAWQLTDTAANILN